MERGLADPVASRITRVRLSAALVLAVLLVNAAIVVFLVAALSDSTFAVLIALGVVGLAIFLLAAFANTFFLRATGSRSLEADEFPWLSPMVGNLAEAAGVQPPIVLIAEQAHMNAYAVGAGKGARIVFFSGLLEGLSPDEVRAVAAHELGHIVNADTSLAVWTWAILRWVLMVKLAALTGAFMLLAFSKGLFTAFSDMGIIGVVAGLTLGLLGALLAAMLWATAQGWALLASLIELGHCRQREFLADATGAAIDGRPDLLASALAKISSGPAMQTGAGTVRSLCIASPLRPSRWWEDALSTHPSTERRIDELLKLPREPRDVPMAAVPSAGSIAIMLPIGAVVVIAVVALLIPQFI